MTGFHKRKVAKAEAAREKAKDKAKQDQLDTRREVSELGVEFRLHINDVTQTRDGVCCVSKLWKMPLRLKRRTGQTQVGPSSVRNFRSNAQLGTPVEQNDDEWHGIPGSPQFDDLARDEEYVNEEIIATVTVVEDFDPAALIHGPSQPKSSSDPPCSIHSDHDLIPPRLQPAPHTTPNKLKPKKIRYETKDARKREQIKQRARKTEKAELAGGKASRKSPRGTRGKHGSKR